MLAASNPHARVPIASITKLMTVLVTLEHARLHDVVTVSRNAAEVGESSIYLRKGDRLTVEELVEAALVQSANDAAVALAEHVGGTQTGFVAMMNAEASGSACATRTSRTRTDSTRRTTTRARTT